MIRLNSTIPTAVGSRVRDGVARRRRGPAPPAVRVVDTPRPAVPQEASALAPDDVELPPGRRQVVGAAGPEEVGESCYPCRVLRMGAGEDVAGRDVAVLHLGGAVSLPGFAADDGPCSCRAGSPSRRDPSRNASVRVAPQRQALLRELRLAHARSAPERTGRPLEEIAAETGFFDQAHLGRLFRRRFGVSPSAYRRQVAASYLQPQRRASRFSSPLRTEPA